MRAKPKPLIILGAGASFDYIKFPKQGTEKYRPPLSDNLFNSEIAEDVIGEFDNEELLRHLASEVTSRVINSPDQTLETFLTSLIDENERRNKQIVALQFYLQKLFQKISDNYYQLNNNYDVLATTLKDLDEACVVTFNYDTLFEQSLFPDVKLEELEHDRDIQKYISSSVKLIKVHGSCNWMSPLGNIKSVVHGREYNNSFDFLIDNPSYIIKDGKFSPDKGDVTVQRDYIYKGTVSDEFLQPRLAVPVVDEEKHFVCPHGHVDALRKFLKDVNRILVIGWKAGDPNLLKFLDDNLDMQDIETLIISGSEDGARRVKKRLDKIYNLSTEATDYRFSNFVGTKKFRKFFDLE